jgi:hypothetical protein
MSTPMLLLSALVLLAAATFAGCSGTPGSLMVAANGIVTTSSGAPRAGALIGPVTLEIGTVGSSTCYWLRGQQGPRHGVVWPFGTTASDGGVQVPGLVQPILPGVPFWSGGGGGADAGVRELGACDAPPDYYLGGQFSFANPVPSGG